jgi:hypothetical protein
VLGKLSAWKYSGVVVWSCALGMFHDSPKRLRQALPYRKFGRKVIFLRQEVETYLNRLPGLQLRH